MRWFLLVFLAAMTGLLVLLPVPVNAADYVCNSCSNCTSTIQSASSGDTVRMTTGISFAGPGACINMSVDGVTFDCQDNSITGSGALYFGIWLESNNNIVRNCRIQDFSYGMFVMGNNNLIENVVCSGNSWAGIDILGLSTGNTIRDSVFSSNTGQQGQGILLTGNVTYNRFINVTSRLNSRGVSVQSSSNYNTFTDLTVDGNTGYGIEINESNNNKVNSSRIRNNPVGISVGDGTGSNLIYNNYFDNTDNANIYPNSGVNNWNITKTPGTNIIGDSYLGGNFWDDYSGQDLDGDGLGDSAYSLGSGNFDYLPLLHPPFIISLVPPTPVNQSVLTRNWIFVNASANKVLGGCRLEWDGVNESAAVSGRSCYVNKTGLSDADYWFRVWGNDSQGNSSGTEMRLVTINTTVTDTTPPNIQYTIQPKLAVNGSNVSLRINASDPSGVDETWLNITLPDSTWQTIYLQNDVLINYTTTSLIGRYDITFFANDTLGNEGNVSDYFDAQESVPTTNFTVNVINDTGGGIVCNLTIYDAGTTDVAAEYQSGDGKFDENLTDGTYDFLFNVHGGDLQVLLMGIDLSQNTNRSIGLDKPYHAYGFVHTYAVQSNYTISNARVRIAYTESSFSNESHVGVYVCEDWNFSQRSCTGSWNKTIAIQNKTQNYFDVYTSGFSAFSIKQEPYCGDGVCSSDENATSCSVDCECNPNEVRPCNITYQGECGKGDEACVDGSWTGCPTPTTETCNGEDDDCNGVIDDVLGGTSVESTQCGCYNGTNPQDEICNGIDDDCDGDIDEEGDCCINNQTRECGPGNETGACQKGLSTCINNVWGSCENATYAKDEICGNDLDDDCDGETDEDCAWDFGLILILVGIIILIVIIILFLHFRSRGKELTWEELKKRWTPAYQ
jgi:hypothetical protein